MGMLLQALTVADSMKCSGGLEGSLWPMRGMGMEIWKEERARPSSGRRGKDPAWVLMVRVALRPENGIRGCKTPKRMEMMDLKCSSLATLPQP